ncbi:MAG: flagellar protein FlaG [Defluviitaleaceae bacterium]|nr:flagellar protein FlaG [Defluviitaleaceae bacterium]
MDVTRISNYTPPMPLPGEDVLPPVEIDVVEKEQLVRASERNEEQKLERAVTELNKSLSSHMRHMSVNVHAPTGRKMVTVYDTDTQEIIREIPPQKVLDAHTSLLEMAGLLVDKKG